MAKIITILLAKAAIETFPSQLVKRKEVRDYLQKIDKSPDEILLDVSYHGRFMEGLPNKDQRGRPDIAHFALLSCFGSILGREQRLRVIIHTQEDRILRFKPHIRLPKNISRFNGLILQVLKHGKAPLTAEPLITASKATLNELIHELVPNHDLVLELSVKGEKLSSDEYSKIINDSLNPLLIFGAFPHGHLTSIPENLIDYKISVFREGLDLFAVISQILASVHNVEEQVLSKEDTKKPDRLSWM